MCKTILSISAIIVGLASIFIESTLPTCIAYILACLYFSVLSYEKYKLNEKNLSKMYLLVSVIMGISGVVTFVVKI